MFVFTIPGKPVPQKQTKFVRKTGIAYDPSAKDLKRIRALLTPRAPSAPIKDPVCVRYWFLFPLPKGINKEMRQQMLWYKIPHAKRPDLDNCAYLLTNAMKGIVYEDDAQVVIFHAYALYAEEPRTIVEVRPYHPYFVATLPVEDAIDF